MFTLNLIQGCFIAHSVEHKQNHRNSFASLLPCSCSSCPQPLFYSFSLLQHASQLASSACGPQPRLKRRRLTGQRWVSDASRPIAMKFRHYNFLYNTACYDFLKIWQCRKTSGLLVTFTNYLLYKWTHQPYLPGTLGIGHENVGKSTSWVSLECS